MVKTAKDSRRIRRARGRAWLAAMRGRDLTICPPERLAYVNRCDVRKNRIEGRALCENAPTCLPLIAQDGDRNRQFHFLASR